MLMLSTEARTLASTLRMLVSSDGRSLRTLGAAIGVKHNTLSQWTTGDHIPTRAKLVVLLDVLGLPDLFKRDVLDLHYSATGNPHPDYAGVAQYLVDRTTMSARDVADVLDALARCMDATDVLCATNIDARDLRAIAAQCTD